MTKVSDKAETKKEKKEYLERKARLFEFEEKNFEKIVIMRATGEYWAVFGHSAIMLVNKIAPELRLRMLLKRDTDFGIKFKEGVVTFRNVDFYKAKLKESTYLEFEKETEDFVAYKLKQGITETEYDLLLRSKEIRKQKLDSLVTKAVPMPKLRAELTEALQLAHRLYVKHGNTFDREFLLKGLTDNIRKSHKIMLLLGRHEIEFEEAVKRIRQYLEFAVCDIWQVSELGIWPVEDATLLIAKVIEAQVALDSDAKMVRKTQERGY